MAHPGTIGSASCTGGDKPAFHEQVLLALEKDEETDIYMRVDLSVRVQGIESTSQALLTASAQSGCKRSIPEESLRLVGWEQAYPDTLPPIHPRG